ncbi:NAD(P)/FAD-dependent oxidoreductase [uncultured Shewanella sp.]|uniref:NAD(P)/FAD-dependent oxidoreductase n=1 Tax=Shewanella atlantica TaxID=271099 RepID=UPI00262997BC|nr:NAD(P)/FAD-dependent oxidoreductase [uncultured Shewanella sp.]
MESVDAIVVGAGVVGLAVAARLSQSLNSVLVIDKNPGFGEETSSRNSEVIHAGIYYPPGSLKAATCVSGRHWLYEYCRQRNIPFKPVGKLIVAQNPQQETYLEELKHRAGMNGVQDLVWLSGRQLQRFSPQLRGCAALLSPSTGIIDSHAYMVSLLAEAELNGAVLARRTAFIRAKAEQGGFEVTLDADGEVMALNCRYLINSAGLYCTKVAGRIEGVPAGLIPGLYWCRGHYFSYRGSSPFDRLVYPVPERVGAGLGIHATLDMGGQLKFGPDTQYIASCSEPDYRVSPSLKSRFVESIRSYFPNIDPERLEPAYSGIRPKLQGPGDSFRDFQIQGAAEHGLQGLVNLYGIESPGLTASLAIARYVADELGIGQP